MKGVMRDHQFVRQLSQTIGFHVRGKRVQIVSHWGGDADSVGASYVLNRLLTDVYESAEVGFIIPEETSAHVKAIMEHLGFAEKLLADPDVYLLVDVGSINQLGDLKELVVGSGKEVIVVDHHLQPSEHAGIRYLVSSKYLAVSEIVFDLVEYLNLSYDEMVSEALFLGMYYDTVRLSVADAEVAAKAARLLNGLDPSKIIGMLEPRIEDSERIARLKALRRTNVFKLGEWFVVVSNVNGYLSSVARTLVTAGAHVALVAGSKGDYTVLAARSSHDFQKYAGVTLGEDLTKYLLSRFEGDGGGHSGAARIRVKAGVEAALTEAVKGLSLLLGGSMVELAG
ncbi:MAG: DHH family phosphoesterase [Candidatus Caldarchaeum sp.]|nr:DHH family phosphoesterase [Candidatus Caldarchaeum sp.]